MITMDSERGVLNQVARVIGNNGPIDDKFWFKSGLSLLVRHPVAPPDYLEEHETHCIPGGELQLGDVVVYFKGKLFRKQTPDDRTVVATKGLDLIRFGVAYADATDQIRVISQDDHGNVWDHSIEELPDYYSDDWDYYGLRIPSKVPETRDEVNQLNPLEVIDTWLAHK